MPGAIPPETRLRGVSTGGGFRASIEEVQQMNVWTRKSAGDAASGDAPSGRLYGALALVLTAALVFTVGCGDDEKVDSPGDATITPAASSPADGEAYSFDCERDHPGTTPDATDFPVEVTDDSGTAITLVEPPEAIASLSAGHTEMLFAMGAGDQVAAVDNTSDCPVSVEDLEQVDAFTPSVEAITALAPDLVIIFFDPGDLATSLTSAGIPVMTLNSPESVEGVYEQIELLGEVTGHIAESELLVTNMSDAVHSITASLSGVAESPRVFHEIDNTFFTAGSGSFIGDLYDLLGADNIANATGEAYPQMTQEAIIAASPDVIILADEEAGETSATVKARPGWDAISAVENDRIYAIDPDIASRPGPRLVDALRILAAFLYPEDSLNPAESPESSESSDPYEY